MSAALALYIALKQRSHNKNINNYNISVDNKNNMKKYCFDNSHMYICSNCKNIILHINNKKISYCPNCGVKVISDAY